ncbi:MAG TPA: hypothetical protein VHB27_14490 [Rhodopila sp.]|uniref:hypothetical protein n=1 Tax=Rhodopila sp. TaxID=2480087 RepID=UPI002C4DFEB4|nr:hypothetical protein [Rhodopila sp.]HVY16431.1 hypothetical protein [Rhodopila sp.]
MIDQPPAVVLGIDDSGGKLVAPGDVGQAHDMAELLKMAPHLKKHPLPLAQAVNHFAHGSDFRVISDPNAFAAEYKAELAKEDPSAPWQAGVIRLRDHGVPDFGAIRAPAVSGGHLVFYAVDTFLGVPYKVVCATLTATPVYEPMPLTPLPAPKVEPREDELIGPHSNSQPLLPGTKP